MSPPSFLSYSYSEVFFVISPYFPLTFPIRGPEVGYIAAVRLRTCVSRHEPELLTYIVVLAYTHSKASRPTKKPVAP